MCRWGFGTGLALFCAVAADAGTQASGDGRIRVWIELADKGPGPVLAPRREEARPLYRPYLEALRRAGAEPAVTLKWQNRVSALASPGDLAALRSLPFVVSVTEFPKRTAVPAPVPGAPLAKAGAGAAGALEELFARLRIDSALALLGREGLKPAEGLRIAVIDADFRLGHGAFSALKSEGRIVDQWDFVEGRAQAVEAEALGYSHGASVLSLLAADQPGVLTGAVPGAGYLLYRAEHDAPETYVEEDYVAAAIERAVDSGANIINISLGYRYEFSDGSPDHPYEFMDGRSRPASLAALGAARRNVLVLASMGNLPQIPPTTPTVVSPADADSILSVGIADAGLAHCRYSCTGPTFDGRLKPEVVSVGPLAGCTVPTADAGSLDEVVPQAGTSFAAPALAGLAALVWQSIPRPDAQQVRRAIMLSGHRAQEPDNHLGHGLPDAARAIAILRAGESEWPRRAVFRIAPGRARSFLHPGGRQSVVLRVFPVASPGLGRLYDGAGRRQEARMRLTERGLEILPLLPLPGGIYWLAAFPER